MGVCGFLDFEIMMMGSWVLNFFLDVRQVLEKFKIRFTKWRFESHSFQIILKLFAKLTKKDYKINIVILKSKIKFDNSVDLQAFRKVFSNFLNPHYLVFPDLVEIEIEYIDLKDLTALII